MTGAQRVGAGWLVCSRSTSGLVPSPAGSCPRSRWGRLAGSAILAWSWAQGPGSFCDPQLGELRSLTQSAVEDFFFRGGRLPADDEGFVRYAEVMVLQEDRRAVEVLRVGYFQHRTRTNGTLDRKSYMEVTAAAGEAAFGHLSFAKPPPGVVGAEDKFAPRRLDRLNRWKPTRAEVVKLRELVNRKAGREIM